MNISAVWMVLNASVNKSLKRNKMKRKLWIRIGAVVLAALLLWWLFWGYIDLTKTRMIRAYRKQNK